MTRAVENNCRLPAPDGADGLPKPEPGELVLEHRKRVLLEGHEMLPAPGVNDAWETIAPQSNGRAADVQRLVEPGKEQHTTHRRARGRDQKPVIAASVRSGDCGAGPPAQAVGLQPLQPRSALEICEDGPIDSDHG